MIEIARERVRIARHVGDERRLEAREPLARERAHPAPRRVHDHRVEALAALDQAARSAAATSAHSASTSSALRLRRGARLRHRRRERLDETHAGAGRREPERDRARPAVEIEHARRPALLARARATPEGLGERRRARAPACPRCACTNEPNVARCIDAPTRSGADATPASRCVSLPRICGASPSWKFTATPSTSGAALHEIASRRCSQQLERRHARRAARRG